MKYKIDLYLDLNKEYDSWEEAMTALENISNDCGLRCTGYSATTFEEAQTFCDNVNDEMDLLNQVHRYGRTPEEALKKLGLYPEFNEKG